MERFKTSTAPRYHPSISLLATLECDAVVRTISEYKTLYSLLKPHIPETLPPNTNLITTPPAPPAWLDATRTLEQTLQTTANRPATLVTAYSQQLERVTTVALHEFFTQPILTVLAAWVGETHLLPAISSLSPPPDAHILLVARKTRQDDAARTQALTNVSAVYGEQNVHLVILNDDGPQSPPSIAAKLDSLARAALSVNIAEVSKAAERARRAARPSFRSWFSTPAPRTFDEPVSDRRLSLSGRSPPRFPPDSLEATTRRLADLYMMSAKYTEAADTYRLLQSDLRGLSGAAIVHEASALEMTALALSLIDGSKQAIGTALEKAIISYCVAGRRELAVRATLRAVDFCTEAGFPDSAAGVIVRAISAILPEKGVATPAGSAFVEGALAVLCSACSDAYRTLRRHRRASLYAFLAATRFSKLRLFAAAACMAREIDDRALFRPSVQNDVELMFGTAEAADGRHARAVNHFVGILAHANARTDVEIQGSAIRGFLSAAFLAREVMSKRWDSGANFPLIQGDRTHVITLDGSGGEDWHTLENDVLEDVEFFRALSKDGETKREKRIEVVAAELRQRREQGDDTNSGSLEMKIRRMRELAETRRKRLRERSLLDRGAVVGERICVCVSLRNPLQFPVFVSGLSAVVSIEGRIYHGKEKHANGISNGGTEGSKDGSNSDVLFFPSEDITLMQNSSQQVSLHISVRKPCEVQFVGICWSFTIGMGGASPKVPTTFAPGFCVLDRRGRRLNDSRQQRASDLPLYAEDKSLIVQVAPLAPRLKASLLFQGENERDVSLEGLVLGSGEIRAGRLRIENEGEAPLEDVVLRVGTPQTLFIGMKPEKEQTEGGKATFAIDVYDNIARQDELTAAAKVTLNLRSNEKREIPVWVRAAVHNSAFGYRSDLHGNIKRTNVRVGATGHIEDGLATGSVRLVLAYGNSRIRVARLDACMKVRPSLTVSPRFLRQANPNILKGLGTSLEGVLLGVEVEHAGSTQHNNVALEVTYLSVTSQSGWRPKSLLDPTTPEDSSLDDIRPSRSLLRINETGTFFVFIVREKDQLHKDSGLAFSPLWQTYKEQLCPYQDANCNEGTQGSSEALFKETKASTHFIVCSQLSSTSTKASGQDMVYVSIGWKSGNDASGELHIPTIDPLRWMKEPQQIKPHISSVSASEGSADLIIPRKTPTDETGNIPSDPIVVRISHPEQIEHDFNPDSNDVVASNAPPAPFPAIVPVDVYIKNVSVQLVDVMFQAHSLGGIADGDRGRIWSGEVSKTLQALSPGAERIIRLSAVLLRPGEYDMTKFNIAYQSTALTTNLRVRKQMRVERSYVSAKAIGRRLWMDYDFGSTDMLMQSMEVIIGPDNVGGSPQKLPNSSVTTPPLQRKASQTVTPTKPVEGPETPRKNGAGRSASAPIPVDRVEEEAPQRATSGRGFGRAPLRSPMDKTTNLLKPSPDDIFWNDADTDESE